ncbi:MAG: helix-turn-helix transcriptional regulator [Acidimicrobiia bacterium]
MAPLRDDEAATTLGIAHSKRSGSVMGAERLMTIGELAEYLQVPRETIYRWRKHGGGPSGFRMGRHVRFRRSDVEAWLEARRDAPPSSLRTEFRFRR